MFTTVTTAVVSVLGAMYNWGVSFLLGEKQGEAEATAAENAQVAADKAKVDADQKAMQAVIDRAPDDAATTQRLRDGTF